MEFDKSYGKRKGQEEFNVCFDKEWENKYLV